MAKSVDTATTIKITVPPCCMFPYRGVCYVAGQEIPCTQGEEGDILRQLDKQVNPPKADKGE